MLPRTIIKSLNWYLTRMQCTRGQFVCHEGQDSENIYIVVKGEFEVSKVIDVNE